MEGTAPRARWTVKKAAFPPSLSLLNILFLFSYAVVIFFFGSTGCWLWGLDIHTHTVCWWFKMVIGDSGFFPSIYCCFTCELWCEVTLGWWFWGSILIFKVEFRLRNYYVSYDLYIEAMLNSGYFHWFTPWTVWNGELWVSFS